MDIFQNLTNASLLTAGTVPLARLSGITTAQLDAAAGILSGQIAGLALSNLTAGTIIPGLILDYGSAAGTGVVVAGSNQILNASTGLAINVKTGESIKLGSNGAGIVVIDTVLTCNARLAMSSQAIRFTGAGTGTASEAEIYADGSSGNLILNVPTGKGVYTFVNGTSYALLVNAASVQVPTKVRFTGAGTGTASEAEIYADGSAGNLILNVPTGKGVYTFVNGTSYALLVNAAAVQVPTKVRFTGAGTGTSNQTEIYADGSAGNLILNVPTGKGVYTFVNGTSYALLVNAASVQVPTKVRFTGAGTGTASEAEIYADAAAGNLYLNAPTAKVVSLTNNGSAQFNVGAGLASLNGVLRFGAAGTGNSSQTEIFADGSAGNLFLNAPSTKGVQIKIQNVGLLTVQHMSGAAVAGITNPLVAYANSSTTTILTLVTTRSGVLECSTNNGQYCRLRVLGTGTPTIEAGSANFVVAGSATSAQFAWNVSGANLQLILGSAAACSISFLWLGTP